MTTDDMPDNLARALKALDDDAARAAARLDSTRVALGVLERLRSEPVVAAQPRRWGGVTLRVAAAAVVLVLGGVIARRLAIAPGGATGDSAWVAIYTDSIVAAAAQASRVPAENPDTVVTVASAVTVDDLNATELRTLLRIMESPEEAQ